MAAPDRSRRRPRDPLTQALLEGKSRYFGRPCSKGHIGERFCSSRKCVDCHRHNVKTSADRYREEIRAKGRTYSRESIEVRRIKRRAKARIHLKSEFA